MGLKEPSLAYLPTVVLLLPNFPGSLNKFLPKASLALLKVDMYCTSLQKLLFKDESNHSIMDDVMADALWRWLHRRTQYISLIHKLKLANLFSFKLSYITFDESFKLQIPAKVKVHVGRKGPMTMIPKNSCKYASGPSVLKSKPSHKSL